MALVGGGGGMRTQHSYGLRCSTCHSEQAHQISLLQREMIDVGMDSWDMEGSFARALETIQTKIINFSLRFLSIGCLSPHCLLKSLQGEMP